MTIKVASLYSGAGGLDYGFIHNKSFEHVFANDFDADACSTYRTNFNDANFLNEGPIEKHIAKLLDLKFDLLIGGFPCPSWSLAGHRAGFTDVRGQEFFTCLSILHLCRPKAFIFENVKGMLSHNNGQSFRFMVECLTNLGYFVDHRLVKMSNYGIPTTRERVLIYGSDSSVPTFIPQVGVIKTHTVNEALQIVGEPSNLYPNHNLHAPHKKLHWISILKDGENLINLSEKEIRQRETNLELEHKSIPSSLMGYRRLDGNKVAPTMMFGNTCLPIHPTSNRSISVREAATLQGFPLDFVFKGGIAAQYKQVGNAVPPQFSVLLSETVSDWFKDQEELRLKESLTQPH